MAAEQRIVTYFVGGHMHQYLVVSPDYILEKFQRLTSRGVRLVPITTEYELHEGMQLEREGAWYEIFMHDYTNNLYFIMREET